MPGGCGSLTPAEPQQGRQRPARPLPDVVSGLLDEQTRKVMVVVAWNPAQGIPVWETVPVTIRAVYGELVAAVVPSGQAGGGGRGAGCALSVEALDLLDRVRVTAGDWAARVGLPPSAEPGDPTPRTLRRLAVHGWADLTARDLLSRILERLTGQAVHFLAGETAPRDMRDHRCPRCGKWTAREWNEDRRQWEDPPVFVVVRDEDRRIAGIQCRACRTWWEWDGLGEDSKLAVELAADAPWARREAPDLQAGVGCGCRSAVSGCRCDRPADGDDGLCSECRVSPRCGQRRAWLAVRQRVEGHVRAC